ncbi:hypothetical protein HYDPIDRAFT_108093, partial [Hydnomerulius pinastri MD-312]
MLRWLAFAAASPAPQRCPFSPSFCPTYRQHEALITGTSAASTVHHSAPHEVDNFSS